MIGARVVKTSLAVLLSILIARSLELHTPHFAGIIAVLSVQPSIYRSLRYGFQHTLSAVMGALVGAYCLYEVGNSFVVMGLVAFLLMAIHVWIKWTSSLLVSVVIAINTLGTTSLYFGESALNQLALVLIGTGVGMLVNVCYRPVHAEREARYVTQSEEMLRSLLYYVSIDLTLHRVTSYPVMRKQIDEVKAYVEKGKEISVIIGEDRRFHRSPRANRLMLFKTFESMAERIRDLSKELQKVDVTSADTQFLQKAMLLVIRAQEHVLGNRQSHAGWLVSVLEARRQSLWQEPGFAQDFQVKLAFYNCYGYLLEYIREMVALQEQYPLVAKAKKRMWPPQRRESASMESLLAGAHAASWHKRKHPNHAQ